MSINHPEFPESCRKRTIRKPSGPVPRHVKDWLEVNGNDCWLVLLCDKCGKWVDSIDQLAPYHMEANWCRRCEGLGSKEAKP